ncbi:ABC transporter permease [Paeniglutamicibacter cryotolerans]|uniref:Peptide/nickel transport system permease protein n=1 Tax=Paeniglutamicibacter cryotolerans TaxID=670079 RepID=A0A839QGQ1_9MICC|nr:ABC transporter permease [Paeniglutamicibacter cryotolerans]MBB2995349.1 peptide/nickel transport system permease protein [Paeniglutamicibacter cryotolerans]
MILFIGRKLAVLVGTVLAASVLVFFSMYMVGDPMAFLLRGRSPSPEAAAAIREQFGLDKPLLVRYFDWLFNMLRGDFGRSFQFREDVATLLASRAMVTFWLVVLSGTMIAVLGLASGIVAALARGRFADKAILIGATGLAAIPSFVGAIVLTAVFSVKLGWFPSFGAGEGLLDTIYHLVLPALALALTFIALVARVTRSSMVEQLDREHVEVATSRGMNRARVVRRHVLRNALNPILTVSGLLVAGLLVASSIVEAAFGLAGLGSLLVQSVDKLDFPVVQAIVLIIVALFVLANTVVDILAGVLDPRTKAGAAAR